MAFVVRMGGRGLAFVMTLFLTRLLGIEEYGVFAYAVAWATILFIPSDLGFQKVILKQVAEYVAVDEPGHILGLLRHAHRIVIPVTFAGSLVAAALAVVVVDQVFLAAVLLILPAVTLRGVGYIWVGLLQGLRQPELSFVPLFIVFPVGLMAMAGGLDLAGVAVNAQITVAIYVAMGAVIMLLTMAFGWHFLRPIVQGAQTALEERRWGRVVLPFTVVSLLTAISAQIGVLVLGGFGEPADVGAFNVAMRLGEPTQIALLAVAVTASPKIAALYRTKDLDGVRRVVRSATRSSFAWCLPLGLVLLVSHEWLLGLFGSGFDAGSTAMMIVVGAYLVNAFAAGSDISMMMTGHLRAVIVARAVSLTVNLGVCLALVPELGATGAAVGFAVDMLIWNAVLTVVAWRVLGVNCTVLPWPRPQSDSTARP